MTPEERFEHIEAILARIATRQETEAEHIAMLLEDSKTRNADIEGLIESSRLLNEQVRLGKAERDQDAENIRRLANIAQAHEHRLDDLEGDKSQ
ncbi:MAG: hypothetical protein HY820_00705 [Acidobacteria bacterium]|nr:hypothetical protein [Acidobacteriota bacterium]